MIRYIFVIINLLLCTALWAPPNCEIYKLDEDCYKACEEAYVAIKYGQGNFHSQLHFDESIRLCPKFAYAYMEKAVPYLKRGDFVTWKRLIDKAVEISPFEYLGYRAWCRVQFLRDYEGGIKDLKQLQSITQNDIGYAQNGDYHLLIALGLWYKEIGEKEKALELIGSKVIEKGYDPGLFDYYHLGILYYELGLYNEAIIHLNKQTQINDELGETYYYLALNHEKLKQMNLCKSNILKAKEYYINENFRKDTYTEPIDKIYLVDIQNKIDSLNLN